MNLKVLKIFVLFVVLLILTFWRARVAPNLELDSIRHSTGKYSCEIGPGRSPVGEEKFDGRKVFSSFGYWSGYGSAGPCFESLNGSHVHAQYLDVMDGKAILMLELRSVNGNRVYGLSYSDNLDRYRRDVASKEYFLLQKILVFVAIALLVYARELYKFFSFTK